MINLSKKEKYRVVFGKNNRNVSRASYFCLKWWKRYEEVGVNMHLCHMFPVILGTGHYSYGEDIEAKR